MRAAAAPAGLRLRFVEEVAPGVVVVCPEVTRTIKLCTAFCVARRVVAPQWLRESVRTRALQPLDGFTAPMARALGERGLNSGKAWERRRLTGERAPGVLAAAPPVYVPVGTTQREDLRALVAVMGGTVVASLKDAKDAARRGSGLAVVASAEAAKEELGALRGAKGVKLAHFYWITDAALSQALQPLEAFPLDV